MSDRNKITQGNTLEVLKGMEAESVNMVMTSPPYWSLRDYKLEPVVWDGDPECQHEWNSSSRLIESNYNSGFNERYGNSPGQKKQEKSQQLEINSAFCLHCNAWKGQLGLEPTFQLYLSHLMQIMNELHRVLRKDGVMFVNLGDSYSGSWGSMSHDLNGKAKRMGYNERPVSSYKQNVPAKSLCGIPERFAIAMTDAGWIRRQTIVWHKPNCMPSSAKDRFTVDFEFIYMFTKSGKYWFEQQFEEHINTKYINQEKYGQLSEHNTFSSKEGNRSMVYGTKWSPKERAYNPQGRAKRAVWNDIPDPVRESINLNNILIDYMGVDRARDFQQFCLMRSLGIKKEKSDLWTIPTQPSSLYHFATFPEALCETPIKAGCPEFVCTQCGQAREKVFETEIEQTRGGIKQGDYKNKNQDTAGNWTGQYIQGRPINTFKGYTTCSCPSPVYRPGVVLDPFSGSATVGVVAHKLNRDFILIEQSPEYVAMAEERLAPLLAQGRLF